LWTLGTYSGGGAADDATTGAAIDDDESFLESPLRRIVFILETTLLNLFFSVGGSVAGMVPALAMSNLMADKLNQ
jgi:hypothetical protein